MSREWGMSRGVGMPCSDAVLSLWTSVLRRCADWGWLLVALVRLVFIMPLIIPHQFHMKKCVPSSGASHLVPTHLLVCFSLYSVEKDLLGACYVPDAFTILLGIMRSKMVRWLSNFYIRFSHYSLGGSWSYWRLSCSNIGMTSTLLLFSLYVWFLNKHLLFVSLCWILVAHGHEESLVVACRLSVVPCRIYFPDQGSQLGSLYWEHRVLATGPAGKSQLACLFRWSWRDP